VSKPLVSIIMPVFNGELYLKQAIGSVLSQTYSNWELLIVDDGSEDTSYEIAHAYSKQNGKIHLLTHPGRVNKGVSATRNVALDNCRGEFTAILDCDDEWLSEKLEKQISIFRRFPRTTIVYGLAETIDKNGKAVNKSFNKKSKLKVPVYAGSGLPGGPYTIFELIVRGKIWIPSPTVLARTEVIKECEGFDETLRFQVEDHLLFTLLAEKGSVYFLNEVLARYRVHSKTWTFELNHKKRSLAYMQYCDRLIHSVNQGNIPLVSREYVDKWVKLAAQGGLKYVISNLNQILMSQMKILLHHRVRKRDKLRCLWIPIGILIRKIYHFFRSRVANPILVVHYSSIAKKKDRINYPQQTIKKVKNKSLMYITDVNLQKIDHYGFSKIQRIPTLYSSTYAVLTGHLFGELDKLTEQEKIEWTNYILSFQREDGLFRDPNIKNINAEMGDSWGWRHLSVHAIAALAALDKRARYPFASTDFLLKPGNTRKWLLSLNWAENSANTSNMVMNYGVFLQYNRDFWNISEAENALKDMYDFLDEIQNPDNGFWGGPFPKGKNGLSLMQQTAYHLWMLYFYDRRPINHIKAAIDSCLELQNQIGGFGPGHQLKVNPNPFTSACEDIDCIDPLCRFYLLINYRRDEIQDKLRKALHWVLSNQNRDGGFVFRRKEPFFYGHRHMSSKKDQSNMFATWFRNLSLAYMSKVLSDDLFFKELPLHFLNCPGYQFWKIQD